MNDKMNNILKKAEDNGVLIITSEMEEMGNSRTYIKSLADSGFLVRESQGIYSIKGESPDEYVIIQKRSSKIIYSYATALFLHGISDRVPRFIDITVPQGYNVSRIKETYNSLRFHYVKEDVFMKGIESVLTPQGYEIIAYNKERCICDLIKEQRNIDKQIYTQSLQEYFRNHLNQRKLIKMARLIGVEQEVRRYMEVLSK